MGTSLTEQLDSIRGRLDALEALAPKSAKLGTSLTGAARRAAERARIRADEIAEAEEKAEAKAKAVKVARAKVKAKAKATD